ncbi:MAG: hypothetical protein ACREXW_09205 [Gammaproteobacteria bacterium]
MDKYFDAFLYLANWGTHELMLRLPRGALDLETARRYLMGDAASARAKGDAVKPADYDEAVRLLGDLKDFSARSGRIAEVRSRIQRIREEHSKKPSFIERLQRAGLLR